MQIRTRKNTLTLIRIKYDPTIKRGRSTCLGSLPKSAESIPPDVDAKLTEKERAKLNAVLAGHRATREIELQEIAARMLPLTIHRAALWYERQQRSTELVRLAQTSRDRFSELLAAMVRAGVGRTRNRRKRSSVAE